MQPWRPHEHWHVDISYLNIAGTFYYLMQRAGRLQPLHRPLGDPREHEGGRRARSIVQRALEKFPGEQSRIISDNGPQFIARDFKEFIRMMGMTHVRTSPYYPQSNGKLERWHAQHQTRVHPAGSAGVLGRGPAVGLLRTWTLQPGPVAQCLGIRHPCGQAQRPRAGDLRRAGSQAGGGATAPSSSARQAMPEVA